MIECFLCNREVRQAPLPWCWGEKLILSTIRSPFAIKIRIKSESKILSRIAKVRWIDSFRRSFLYSLSRRFFLGRTTSRVALRRRGTLTSVWRISAGNFSRSWFRTTIRSERSTKRRFVRWFISSCKNRRSTTSASISPKVFSTRKEKQNEVFHRFSSSQECSFFTIQANSFSHVSWPPKMFNQVETSNIALVITNVWNILLTKLSKRFFRRAKLTKANKTLWFIFERMNRRTFENEDRLSSVRTFSRPSSLKRCFSRDETRLRVFLPVASTFPAVVCPTGSVTFSSENWKVCSTMKTIRFTAKEFT